MDSEAVNIIMKWAERPFDRELLEKALEIFVEDLIDDYDEMEVNILV